MKQVIALIIAVCILAMVATAQVNYPKGNTREFWLSVQNPSTGAATNADSGTVTFSVYIDDATTTAFSTGTCVQGATGSYFGTYSTSSIGVGSSAYVVATATVSSVAGKAVVDRIRVVGTESTAGYPKTDINSINLTAATFGTMTGTPSFSGGTLATSSTYLTPGTFTAANYAAGTTTLGWFSVSSFSAANAAIGTTTMGHLGLTLDNPVKTLVGP